MPKLIEPHYKYSQEGLTLDAQEEISLKNNQHQQLVNISLEMKIQ